MQLTALLGREHEIATLCQLLNRRDTRLVTITGPPGVGKTSLALAVAHTVQDAFADGVFFVSLAPINDPTLIVQTIAQTLSLPESSRRLWLDSLKAYLQNRQLLLVLDNFEQIVTAAPLLTELLTACARLQMLVTSREALRLRGEQEFLLSPLALPDRAALETLHQVPSIALFVQRAQATQLDFQLTEQNAAAVAEVCTLLDGLPLAIELAAARIKFFPPQAMLEQLQASPLQLLRGGARDLPPRQQTLSHAVQWSYDLLEEGEQRAMRWFSVFVGGSSLEAILAVLGPPTSVDVLDSLMNKSLLRRIVTNDAPRFVMLETLRDFGTEQLAQTGESAAARHAHAIYYASLAEEAEPHLFGSEQKAWLLRLEVERDNLRAALAWTLESKRIEAGLRLASALVYFREIHGYVQESLTWFERLLVEADERVSLEVRVNALVFATFESMLLGKSQAATKFAREAVDLAEADSNEDSRIHAFARDGLASAAKTVGDYQTAFDITEQNIHFYRRAGPRHYLGIALLSQGENAVQLGYYEIARERLNESLALASQDGDAFRRAYSLNTLGDLSRLEQRYTEAASAYERGVKVMRELGAQRDLASLLCNLGFTYLHLGDVERAHDLFSESLAIHQAQQNQPGMIECLIGFAVTAIEVGQAAAGVRLLAAATALSEQPSVSIWKATQMEIARYFNLAQRRLTETNFQMEQMAGAGLLLEQAVQVAEQLEIRRPIPSQAGDSLANLTSREREVAELIAQGKTNRQIAEELVLSPRTVEKHAANILAKLGLANRAQIVRHVIGDGLTEVAD